MAFQHKSLGTGRWHALTLCEQMGNIGSEVLRAFQWKGKDEKLFWKALERALELFEFTLEDNRWKGRLREIARAREVFLDTAFSYGEYKTKPKDLIRYFDEFAIAARLHM